MARKTSEFASFLVILKHLSTLLSTFLLTAPCPRSNSTMSLFFLQCERCFSDSVRDPWHHPGYGDLGTLTTEAADSRNREADQGTVAADSHHHAHHQHPRRWNHCIHYLQLRDTDVLVQDGVASPCHLRHEPAPQDQSHLRVFRWYQGDRVHIHFAEEHSEEVYRDLGFKNTGKGIVGYCYQYTGCYRWRSTYVILTICWCRCCNSWELTLWLQPVTNLEKDFVVSAEILLHCTSCIEVLSRCQDSPQ